MPAYEIVHFLRCLLQNFPNLFGQPFVCLLSPEVIPESMENSRHRGNIFTLFLHCPLTAFCFVCGLGTVELKTWDKARGILDAFLTECYRILTRSRNLGEFILLYEPLVLRICIICMVLNDCLSCLPFDHLPLHSQG